MKNDFGVSYLIASPAKEFVKKSSNPQIRQLAFPAKAKTGTHGSVAPDLRSAATLYKQTLSLACGTVDPGLRRGSEQKGRMRNSFTCSKAGEPLFRGTDPLSLNKLSRLSERCASVYEWIPAFSGKAPGNLLIDEASLDFLQSGSEQFAKKGDWPIAPSLCS